MESTSLKFDKSMMLETTSPASDPEACVPQQSPERSLSPTTKARNNSLAKINNVFIAFDDSPTANPANVHKLRALLQGHGFRIHLHSGTYFSPNKHVVDSAVIEALEQCATLIVCASRELYKNWSSKALVMKARDMKVKDPRDGPEILVAMMQGDFTSQSQPDRITGWLAHLIKDSVWYPTWSPVMIDGTFEAILGVLKLKKKQIKVGGIPEGIWDERARTYKLLHKDDMGPPPKVPVSPIVERYKKMKKKKVPTIGPLDHSKAFFY